MRRKGKKNTQIDDKLIDEVVRMSYGFSEEQIRAEMEDALAHPDNSPELKAPDDEFQQILQKMKEWGITPRISEDGDKDEGHPAAERGRTRLSSRRFRRLLLAAAVLGVIGIGFSLNAVGKSATKYQVINGEKNNIVWGNVKVWDGIDNVEEAYEQIEEELKILPLKMGYIPKEMVFEDLLLRESYGVMSFKYQAKSLWIYDHKIKNEVNGIQGSDREKSLDSVYNPWLNEKIEVYQEDSETGSFRYSVTIKTDDASYIVTGDIDKNEFLKVVEGLYINR